MLRSTLVTTALSTLALGLVVGCSDDDDPNPQNGTIVDVAAANGDFSTLVSALEAAGLDATLAGEGPFTVFAPTNAAFDALPAGALDALLADTAALERVLTYHVVPGRVSAAQVVTLSSATTVNGADVEITVDGDEVRINGALVTMTDIEADNGVIHVIDAVLMPPEETSNTIVDVAVADGRFTTLVSALEAAGLDAALAADGPFTVFAPTDDAFAAIPEADLNALLADTEALTEVLQYHVVSGRVDAAAVAELSQAMTLAGATVDIRVEGEAVFVNDAQVILTDIEADNGIIHVIDAVLMPPEAPGTIVDVAVANEDFSTLVTALQAADLVGTLEGEGPFTVFAPTNAAFAAIPEADLNALLADVPELTKVLTYHVVSGAVSAEQVVTLDSATSLQGAEIDIRVEGEDVFVNGAQVVMTDIQASNGVIHVIDAVITPPTIVDIAAANPDFSTLVTAVQTAGLVETLSGPGPFTVFAPTNAAFAAIPEAELNALLQDVPALTEVLTYHVVPGDNRAADVVTLRAASTVQGSSAVVNTTGAMPMINGATIVQTDIIAGNGVIHVIDAVITPPTVAELVSFDPDLSTLLSAVGAANLGGTLSGAGPFTVLAPNDAAFDAVPEADLNALLQDVPALTNVLTYHVIGDELTSDEVIAAAGQSVPTLQGQSVDVSVMGEVVRVDEANVVFVDLQGTNGVVHVLDAVLFPTPE